LFLRIHHSATAPTAPHTLSLHDALPIYHGAERNVPEALAREPVTLDEPAQHGAHHVQVRAFAVRGMRAAEGDSDTAQDRDSPSRSEEHTSELQSRENLVCRLLLEKKK